MEEYIFFEKKRKRVTFIVDDRERDLAWLLHELGADVEVYRLEVGDVIVSSSLVIERKSANDFYRSIYDSRLFEQIYEMRRNFEKAAVIIEGPVRKDNVYYGIVGKLAKENVFLFHTKNLEETAKLIYYLGRHEQKIEERQVFLKGRKKPKDKKELLLFVVSSFPGIGEKKAKKLLKEFGSIKGIVNATHADLRRVLGESLGKKLFQWMNMKWSDEDSLQRDAAEDR